jgi:hypothetical protein
LPKDRGNSNILQNTVKHAFKNYLGTQKIAGISKVVLVKRLLLKMLLILASQVLYQ